MAVAAIDVHFGADEVAGLHGGSFFANSLDDTAKFVAEGDRRLDAALRPAVPAVDVEVCAADGRGFHANEDVGGADSWDGRRFNGEATRGLHFAQSFHGGRHRVAVSVEF